MEQKSSQIKSAGSYKKFLSSILMPVLPLCAKKWIIWRQRSLTNYYFKETKKGGKINTIWHTYMIIRTQDSEIVDPSVTYYSISFAVKFGFQKLKIRNTYALFTPVSVRSYWPRLLPHFAQLGAWCQTQ